MRILQKIKSFLKIAKIVFLMKIKNTIIKTKIELKTLYIAYKRHDIPIFARIIIILVVGYALSPIDLIPDFIPVIGYIDDLIIIPLGIFFAFKLIPENILNECRSKAEEAFKNGKPKSLIAGIIIVLIWLIIITLIAIKVYFILKK